MTAQIEQVRELILTTAEYLKAWGIEIPEEIKQRDKREPGRKEKMEIEDRIFSAITKRWKKQARFIRDQLELMHPDRKVVAPPYEQILEESFSDKEDFIAEFIRILKDAIRQGFKLFGQDIPFSIDWTLANDKAAKRAREYAYDFVEKIDDTTLGSLRNAFASFVETPGMTIGDIMGDLMASGFSESRALSIAVTETTRAYADANMIAGEELKRQYPDVKVVKIWTTNNDDLVCDICAPLDGMIIEMEEGFTTVPEDVGEGLGIDAPPAHINCRCWLTTTTALGEE